MNLAEAYGRLAEQAEEASGADLAHPLHGLWTKADAGNSGSPLSPSCVGLAEYVVERRIAALPSRRGGSKQYSRMPENRRACGFPAMPCGSRYGFRALGYVRAIRPPRCLRQALSILRTSQHLTARENRSRCHDP